MGTTLDVCWIWNINQISFQGPLQSCIIPSYMVFPLALPQSMSFVSGRPDSPDACPVPSYPSEWLTLTLSFEIFTHSFFHLPTS